MGLRAEMAVIAEAPAQFPVEVETLVIGAGAAGMIAALAANDAGESVLVLERGKTPTGSTALSAGLIPAAGTRFQTALGITDGADIFAADIQRKANNENDTEFVTLLANQAAQTVEWLADRHGLPFSLVDNFDYPGHSRRRMHGLPTRSGQELVDRLRMACEAAGIDILCEATATTLLVNGHVIRGVAFARPGGSDEMIGCGRLILACNGYGGNPHLVKEYMPEIADALWFGHDGNKGDAVAWGDALGARLQHLGAYQGHGNVAHPHGILITWATMTEGGIQVNNRGERFWDESHGYSEAARAVLAQPEGEAYAIFDSRIADIARQFSDFRDADMQGAIKSGNTPAELANALGLPADTLEDTLAAIPVGGTDRFGRTFGGQRLSPPYLGVKVTGALFHTQGGLVVGQDVRVLKADGSPFPNLFATGGAAVGVSGAGDSGYLSGNGLLSAVVLGKIAGQANGNPV